MDRVCWGYLNNSLNFVTDKCKVTKSIRLPQQKHLRKDLSLCNKELRRWYPVWEFFDRVDIITVNLTLQRYH